VKGSCVGRCIAQHCEAVRLSACVVDARNVGGKGLEGDEDDQAAEGEALDLERGRGA
jgi:hypothetical protein